MAKTLLNRALCFVLRDLASCKVQLSKPRIEPLITSQLQVEPVLQMAEVGHCCCRARARDGAWMTRLARTRARAHKGGQSGSMPMPEDGPAPMTVLCAVSTPHPAYLDPAGIDSRTLRDGVQVCKERCRNRTENSPRCWPVLRHWHGPALTALMSLGTRSRQLGQPRSVTESCPAHGAGRVQICRMARRNRTENSPGCWPVLRY